MMRLLAVVLLGLSLATPAVAQTVSSYPGPLTANGDASYFDDVPHPYRHITAATTTTLKTGAGALHQVIINSKAGAAATATIYDNTAGSGTVIAILDITSNSAVTINYDVAFTTGLTIVTTATCDLTVTYR